MNAFYYATVNEVIADLKPERGGNESSILKSIKVASEFILKRPELGQFFPSIETKRFDGNGRRRLNLPPFLAITSITIDGTLWASTDYIKYPLNKHWENGPYSWLEIDPDGSKGWFDKVVNGVVIAATWGKYSYTSLTGATVQNDPLASNGTSLIVDDGSKIGIGMLLLMGSEQAFVNGRGDPTANVTTASVAIAKDEYLVTLADATKVNVGEIIRCDLEDMKILSKNATTKQIYVKRAYNDTELAAHLINTPVDVYRTFTIDRGVNGSTAASQTKATAISRYEPPEQINSLCKQIACNLQNLAESGYTGKSGNSQTGVETYSYAFPRDAELQKYYDMFNLWEE